ncbi:MAG: hypothetical protein CVU84_13835 [Firmicutes bacterium HGW-Firmicutes-1]|jgi:flagellin|nr:MAG: hypothetical protein CVU84_13835 [Firmicutes bacterium HGW-Firmicutes-1]
MRINHNIPALRALHQLDKSNGRLDKTLERLSSGLRINHAADDAAGLAITQKMDTQVRGLGQASRNAMDGISLIQTAEGALNEVHAMLQRIRELAVQVSNGTYDSKDRKAVQDEVGQLLSEIERISTDIEFNEMKLLDGSLDRRAFSTDEARADIISMSDTVDAGAYALTVTTVATQSTYVGVAVPAGSFVANKITMGGTININGEQVEILVGDTGDEVFAKLRDLCGTVDTSLTISSMPLIDGKILTLTNNQFGNKSIVITGTTSLITGLGLGAGSTNTTGLDAAAAVVSGFPAGTTVSGAGKDLIFRSNNDFELKLASGTVAGAVTMNILATGPLDLQIGANEGQFMEIRIQNLSPSALGITKMNLSTSDGAQEAITIVDLAIQKISAVRSKLGAYQNRLEHTINNLESASENMTASFSRIQDADMAYEMANFTQQNIIAQAGTSMLAQANQRPQSLLQLLQQ